MDHVQRGVLLLLKSAITGQALPLPEAFSLEAAMPLVKAHRIVPLVYEGAILCGIDAQKPPMQQLLQEYCRYLLHSERQMQALEPLFAAFDANGIDYMPLKGCNLKKLYPKPEHRPMGDADVLIRMEQYDRICPLLKQLGFEEKKESDHELVWQKQTLYLELHKRLIPSYNKDYYAYYGEGWQLAKKQEGGRYALTPEDEWIYLFTHFAKHYRDGGIGCRHVLDLWVYRRSHENLQEDYIREELKKLKLDVFHENICRLLRVWFADEKPDKISEKITHVVWQSGCWGGAESHNLSRAAKDNRSGKKPGNAKGKAFLKAFFPGVRELQYKYTVLQKAKFLLPVVWVIRWIDVLLNRRKNIKKRMRMLEMITDESVEAYRLSLEEVGLHWGEKPLTVQRQQTGKDDKNG